MRVVDGWEAGPREESALTVATSKSIYKRPRPRFRSRERAHSGGVRSGERAHRRDEAKARK
ncbi:protein of unknown function [Agreia sp. COWG]|nr:protein of unknown function [Agreia sp. COWG]